MLAGAVMAGGSVSLTVTVKLADPGFPAGSVAVQVTVVVPSAKNEPDAGAHTVVAVGSSTVGAG
jgi:hypothetical protein